MAYIKDLLRKESLDNYLRTDPSSIPHSDSYDWSLIDSHLISSPNRGDTIIRILNKPTCDTAVFFINPIFTMLRLDEKVKIAKHSLKIVYGEGLLVHLDNYFSRWLEYQGS